ncbi:putative lactoylglutathione lyase [Streptomyces sp. AK010]|nr:putative lactoylglutathione lyase [Streptomyces sp. AK010]
MHEPARPVEPRPTEEDLLVVHVDGPVPDDLVARPEEHGGKRVESPNPYWTEWGVTIEDPDGYRLVLCRRAWSSS